MVKRIFKFFSTLPMLIVSGTFLVFSLILILTGVKFPIDPAFISILISGTPIAVAAFKGIIKHKKITSSLLITIAMIASIFVRESFAAGEIAFIMAIGEMLEEKTIAKASKGIREMIELVPCCGRRIRNGIEEMIDVSEIKWEDVLRVFPGETIPVDGKIIVGKTSVNQSIMTGESLPVDKSEGDEVFGGTTNQFGAIDILATAIGEDSTLQKMIRLVKEAEDKKAPTQKIADSWASFLVPVALLIAVVTLLMTNDGIRAVTVLVVFCPCALTLATPTSIMAAIGQATKHGVLIKSGEALENMGKVNIAAFDKTGTLTEGNLTVSDCISFVDGISDDDLLTIAASVESKSEHPLGKAILAYAKEKETKIYDVKDFVMLPGMGVIAKIGSREFICGNSKLLSENQVGIFTDVQKTIARLREDGKALIIVGGELTPGKKKCVGVIALSDTIRKTALKMIDDLHDVDVKTVLLTGDHIEAANYFAKQLGIDKVYAELLPAQKVEEIKKIHSRGKVVAMIGDGVNDAPALKTADVGVAMGSIGSDIAIEAADIALMGDDITKLPYIKRLSNATIKNIHFNIALSMTISFISIALSITGILNPVTGALVHNASSVLVVLNSARLYERKF